MNIYTVVLISNDTDFSSGETVMYEENYERWSAAHGHIVTMLTDMESAREIASAFAKASKKKAINPLFDDFVEFGCNAKQVLITEDCPGEDDGVIIHEVYKGLTNE